MSWASAPPRPTAASLSEFQRPLSFPGFGVPPSRAPLAAPGGEGTLFPALFLAEGSLCCFRPQTFQNPPTNVVAGSRRSRALRSPRAAWSGDLAPRSPPGPPACAPGAASFHRAPVPSSAQSSARRRWRGGPAERCPRGRRRLLLLPVPAELRQGPGSNENREPSRFPGGGTPGTSGWAPARPPSASPKAPEARTVTQRPDN
ncbi:nascent polypeptide-associated complex subunit alpha, muscle-specific form-like isoform X2 [Acinonyx jubatus]|uniref:Nascent polypeptide-associated complex subunit alpha, muscle-specific form-like isoform X2 n=1 Tax=Acinonyx jubatus TaxID=32536 RepID=A0ABM3NQY6_ACIJB|nr:nascent polypeptide-associated complex subunit alpha, muscle-specific form-like isoform X2 [Acinonyx jubatus]